MILMIPMSGVLRGIDADEVISTGWHSRRASQGGMRLRLVRLMMGEFQSIICMSVEYDSVKIHPAY